VSGKAVKGSEAPKNPKWEKSTTNPLFLLTCMKLLTSLYEPNKTELLPAQECVKPTSKLHINKLK